MDDKNKSSEMTQDQALDKLLESALQDFNTDPPQTETVVKSDTKSESTDDNAAANEPQEWSEEFVQQAALQFEQNFAKLLNINDNNVEINPELIQEKVKQIADAAQQVAANPNEVTDESVDFASSISHALAGLSQGQENLNLNESDILNMFGGGGSDGNFLPFMQGMMQGLLSKEVLAPSLEELVQKLPVYLETNKETLSKEDAERYQKQKDLMDEILVELNQESETDSKEVKKERFSKVLALMQKLQDYGQPPKELVGDVGPPFAFDAEGNPTGFPTAGLNTNQDCSIM